MEQQTRATRSLTTSTPFTLLALPTFYVFVHDLQNRWGRRLTAVE